MPGEYTININLNSASKSDAGRSDNSSSEDKEQERLQRAKSKLEKMNQKTLESEQKAADAEASKEARAAEKLAKHNKMMAKAGALMAVDVGWNSVKTFYLSNVGEKFGDEARQNQINNTLKMTTDISQIAGAGIAGAVMGGPAGAAIALVGTLANQVIQVTEAQAKWVRQQHEYDLTEVRASERLGMDISKRNRTR